MAKPRNSVLYMFDPLHQAPSTPRRDSSDDLGPSDKENDVPAGDLTIFFNRTFATHKQPDTKPLTPMGKLIDFGDTPAPARLWDAAEHDGSDADGEQSESDAESCGVVSPPRVPLAELDVEHTPRPQLGGRTLSAPVFVSPKVSPDSEALPAVLVPAPSTSPLAEVINSINFSAMTISEDMMPTDEHHPTQPPCEVAASRQSSPFPEINVCAPETPCVDKLDLPKDDEDNDVPVAAFSHLRPSSTLTQLSPDDPRRASVDLQSSFHLQMQSAEMSFDLLNDKVSFFGNNGQDSFWSGGDDTLDFGEICVPPAMKAKLEALVPVAMASREIVQPVFSPPTKASPVFERPSVTSPTTEKAANVPLPLSPAFSAPPSRNATPPRVSALNFDEPPSPPTSPVVADEPSLLLESEPLPPPMSAPVPALRIVKKTFKVSSHQSATQGPASSKPAIVAARVGKEPVLNRRPLATAKPAGVSAPAAQPSRPPIRGVQRPPAGMQAGSLVIGLPPHGGSSTASTASTSSSGTSAGSRPARTAESAASASRFAGIQRPNLAAKERAAPPAVRAPTGGPRSNTSIAGSARAQSGTARTTSMPKPVSSVVGSSALRPPSRIAAPGLTALPKPASRLPGLTRTASVSSGSSTASAGTAASRSRASTLSRATGRFF